MEQLLSIQPDGILRFELQNNQYVARIVLQNVSAIFVAFKVRLSNQNDYSVKPNIGVLRAGNSVTLQLTTSNAITINMDRVQILAGPITINEDVVQFFKNQQRLNQRIIKCSTDDASSLQSTVFKSSISPQEINDFKTTTIKTEYVKPQKKQQQSKDILSLEDQIKKIVKITNVYIQSEDLKVIKDKQNDGKITVGIKQFLISILISMIVGVYITYRQYR
ncbi:unnamed protein product (macronuclear) [Paramecium tetraurelia]|uniref:MSP domain-containing protein n=1 Tax=Paramecium tetraurelia TaxID=5888 RepID=A0C499_PARTE|nr:uncharacterized protein GSPATT00035096001 [Paramecium tetraurelia]CAK65616.1 unnamed protein product [Paramecium tetraurelia]|eukprot:XP_001433013.1 hypothetical protein (macronuclear) [Paramecium tetraurelia strain d4-2]